MSKRLASLWCSVLLTLSRLLGHNRLGNYFFTHFAYPYYEWWWRRYVTKEIR